jgi:hypothetical protein
MNCVATLKASAMPDDFLSQLAVNNSAFNEPSFDAYTRLLTPQRDYGLIANWNSSDKFVVSNFGIVKVANNTGQATPEVGRSDLVGGGYVLFDPRQYVHVLAECPWSAACRCPPHASADRCIDPLCVTFAGAGAD